MSFNQFLRSFIDLKGLKKFSSERDILNEPETPQELRDCLRSNELEGILSNTQNFMEEESIQHIPDNQNQESEDDEGNYLDARSYISDENDDQMDDGPAHSIYRANSKFSISDTGSSIDLTFKSLSKSLTNDSPTDISITKILPVRNSGVIIHWKTKNNFGIRGYKVIVDGHPLSLVHSSRRTSAFIDDVEMNCAHQFAVTAVQDEEWTAPLAKTNANLTAIYNYTPHENNL